MLLKSFVSFPNPQVISTMSTENANNPNQQEFFTPEMLALFQEAADETGKPVDYEKLKGLYLHLAIGQMAENATDEERKARGEEVFKELNWHYDQAMKVVERREAAIRRAQARVNRPRRRSRANRSRRTSPDEHLVVWKDLKDLDNVDEAIMRQMEVAHNSEPTSKYLLEQAAERLCAFFHCIDRPITDTFYLPEAFHRRWVAFMDWFPLEKRPGNSMFDAASEEDVEENDSQERSDSQDGSDLQEGTGSRKRSRKVIGQLRK